MNKSHLTAIRRTKISAPIKELIDWNEVGIGASSSDSVGDKILDYGCGRGYDADAMNWYKYDPHYFPSIIADDYYDIVICQYVLNVISSKKERVQVINSVLDCLKGSGKAFFIVRDDIKEDGLTAKGTWQGVVNLDEYMRIWGHKKGKYKIYVFSYQYYDKLRGYVE